MSKEIATIVLQLLEQILAMLTHMQQTMPQAYGLGPVLNAAHMNAAKVRDMMMAEEKEPAPEQPVPAEEAPTH